MAFADSKSCSNSWKVSVSAKAEGLVTAELQVASPGELDKNWLLAYLARIKRRSSMRKQTEGAVCDASLRVRTRLFFFRARLIAGRLRELHAQRWQCNLIHYRSSGKAPRPLPSFFKWFKGSSRSRSLETTPSYLSLFFRSKRQRKGSFLVCGAGAGAFVFFLLHHASSWATHFPTFAWNAGSRLIALFAKFVHKKCDSAGSKGAACFWQGVRDAMSIFQMIMSLVSPIISGYKFVNTMLLTLFIGVLLMGRASLLQYFLDRRKTQGKFCALKGRMLSKLLSTMQLIKPFLAHIGMKQACVFLLLLAFLTNAMSKVEGMT